MPSLSHVLRVVLQPLLVVGLLLALVVPAPAAQASTSTRGLEQDLLALVNVERAKQGLGALTEHADIRTVAREHSAVMASQGRLHHNPSFSTQITGWQRVSENVGYGPSVESIHRALMDSEGHRDNILDDRVSEVGIGVVVEGSRVWVTQNFRRPAGTVTLSAPSTVFFGDVSGGSVHAAAIQHVFQEDIAEACGVSRFCPADAVTRGEFATMLVRALQLDRPTSAAGLFTDVSGEVALDVEALAAAGLTNGCNQDEFCVDVQLTREQLASFYARALNLEPAPSPFLDTGETHGGSVGALAAAGITNGCRIDRYCPTDRVTRAQTASMLFRHFG